MDKQGNFVYYVGMSSKPIITIEQYAVGVTAMSAGMLVTLFALIAFGFV
jgi:hypothetical protein